MNKEQTTKNALTEIKPVLAVAIIDLVDYNNIENSLLVKAVREFYNCPNQLHDFRLVNETNHYVEIEFYNYQKTHCSVVYQKDFNEVRLKKGSGGVNFNYIKLVNNLINLGVFVL